MSVDLRKEPNPLNSEEIQESAADIEIGTRWEKNEQPRVEKKLREWLG